MSLKAEEREKILALINHPPAGGKIAAAKDFGIDLTLNLRQMSLSFAEKLADLQGFDSAMRKLRIPKRT
jgi:hypothetical protein